MENLEGAGAAVDPTVHPDGPVAKTALAPQSLGDGGRLKLRMARPASRRERTASGFRHRRMTNLG